MGKAEKKPRRKPIVRWILVGRSDDAYPSESYCHFRSRKEAVAVKRLNGRLWKGMKIVKLVEAQ